MAGVFPSEAWLEGLIDRLNADEKYAKAASQWEGDLTFEILAEGPLEEDTYIYLDLWHGKCRGGRMLDRADEEDPAFTLTAPFSNFSRVVKGELDAMQALLTRKLTVKGNLGYMMRNVPTVLDFVRCAQSATEKVLGDD